MTVGRHKIVLWNQDHTFEWVRDNLVEMAKKYDWTYFHCAQEHCRTTDKAHVDGYYETANQRRWQTEHKKFVKVFGTGYGDFQFARGNAGENIDYSEKEEGTFYKQGEVAPAGQGNRADIAKRAKQVMDGDLTAEQLCEEDPEFYHKYGRTFHKLEDIALRKKFRTEMTEGIWLFGPTGVGKSHAALSNYHPETHYLWKLNDKGWQDGYTGQPIVVINEFRGSISYDELLQLVDKWPYTVPRRGREPVPFLAKKVIITSPLRPEEVYHHRHEKDGLDQFRRRFQVIEMDPNSEV